LLKRTIAIAKKEIRQLKRDTRLLFVIFFFPVFLLIIFGYAVNFDVKHIQIAVYDQDRSELSRDFIRSLTNSEYFDLQYYLGNDKNINSYLDEKKVQCVVVIPNDFSQNLNSHKDADIQFLIDGVDGNTATIIQNYVTGASISYGQKINVEMLAQTGRKSYQPISLESRFWFNPDLETTRFLIPGLIAMILIVIAVVTVSLSLVREKEKGTMEQLNVSSLSTIELLLGKNFPYVVLSLINAAFILVAGYLLFGVEVKGSILLLFFSTLIFLMASTSLGIFVSVVSNSQQVAFTIATFLSLLPSVILSGFIFPIDSMPVAVQVITNITPAKFFIVILRAIMLRGVGLEAFWEQVIYLLIFALVMMMLSTIINKKKTAAA
jgi:drug efflux transport system permease protein